MQVCKHISCTALDIVSDVRLYSTRHCGEFTPVRQVVQHWLATGTLLRNFVKELGEEFCLRTLLQAVQHYWKKQMV